MIFDCLTRTEQPRSTPVTMRFLLVGFDRYSKKKNTLAVKKSIIGLSRVPSCDDPTKKGISAKIKPDEIATKEEKYL